MEIDGSHMHDVCSHVLRSIPLGPRWASWPSVCRDWLELVPSPSPDDAHGCCTLAAREGQREVLE